MSLQLFALSTNLPNVVLINQNQAFNLCTVSNGGSVGEINLNITLSPARRNDDFELFIVQDGMLVKLEFNDQGFLQLKDIQLNTCAQLIGTFSESGGFTFTFDLVTANNNIPLIRDIYTVTVVE